MGILVDYGFVTSYESQQVEGNSTLPYPYQIIHVPRDDAGTRKYLDGYKAFRLPSLHLAPEAFSSTYAREVSFTDDIWYGRLCHPGASTFMAVGDSGQIISVSTMI
jgi:hypothetical protein